jgi:L-threonylcarbamoyladenylate synthase
MMNPRQLPITRTNLAVAAGVIQAGGIVAFPTETSYGLAVDPFSSGALARLFQIKQRATAKALPVLVSNESQLPVLINNVPDLYLPLIKTFWPGPLTLIFEGREHLPKLLTGGLGEVAVRISSHPVAQRFVDAVSFPITATSANISGMEPALTASAVSKQLGNLVDCILDEDAGVEGSCSTIIGIGNGQIELLRAGVLAFDAILRAGK